MKSRLILLLCLLPVLQACKNRQGRIKNKVEVQKLDFHYFSSKAKVNYSDDSQSIGFSTSVKIVEDSLIWLSVSKSNIPVLRAKIEKDTIRYIQFQPRSQKGYYVYAIDRLSEKIGFQLSYDMLEGMLLGNRPIPQAKMDEVTTTDAHMILKQNRDKYLIQNQIEKNSSRLTALEVWEEGTKNNVVVDYSDFEGEEGKNFPHTFIMEMAYEADSSMSEVHVELKHNKVRFPETLTTPFKVPSSYQVHR